MERARILRHDTPTTRWDLAMRRPGAPLRSVLRDALCGYRETTAGPSRRTELPGVGAVLILDLGELRIHEGGQPVHHRGGFAAGIGDTPTVTEHDGLSCGIQVNLAPLAARRVFGVPMAELANCVVTLDDLLDRPWRGLADRVHEARSWDERFDRVEAFVAARIAVAPEVPRWVEWALDRIVRSAGRIDVAALARETGYSRKHLVETFRVQVGMPPKRVARLARFDAVIRHLKGGSRESWGHLAHRFGYADQSHLNREFRAFAGETPTETRDAVAEVGELFG